MPAVQDADEGSVYGTSGAHSQGRRRDHPNIPWCDGVLQSASVACTTFFQSTKNIHLAHYTYHLPRLDNRKPW